MTGCEKMKNRARQPAGRRRRRLCVVIIHCTFIIKHNVFLNFRCLFLSKRICLERKIGIMKYLICVILAVCCQQSITLDVHSQQHIPISPNQDYLSNKSSEQGGEGGSRGGDEDDMFEFTNKIAEKYIWKTVPVFFLILGTVANILSIIVFTRKEMIKFSSFVYFAFLNGVNLAVLYVTMIRIISEYFDTDIRSISVFTCKAHVFLTYFLGNSFKSLLRYSIYILIFKRSFVFNAALHDQH